MQHLSRRFSGFVFLYVVIANTVYAVLFNLGFFYSSTFLADNYTIILLIIRLIIFLPPIIFIAVRKYPVAGVLRLNTFSGKQLFFAVVLSIWIYLFMSPLMSLFDNLFGHIFFPDFSWDIFNATGFSLWPALLTTCLLLAVLNELIFRGAVQSGFRNISPLKACLIVGVFFGLFQMSIFSFLQYAVFGFTLCYLSNRSGSIIPGMLTVFLVTFFRIINLDGWLYFSFFAPSGINQFLTAIIMIIASIIIGGILVWKMPDTSSHSKQIIIKLPHFRELIKKFPEFRRRLQQSFLSDYNDDENKKRKKRLAANEPVEPTLSIEEIYPSNEPKQSKNTGFIIGTIILIASTLFMLGLSIYLYILNATEMMQ